MVGLLGKKTNRKEGRVSFGGTAQIALCAFGKHTEQKNLVANASEGRYTKK